MVFSLVEPPGFRYSRSQIQPRNLKFSPERFTVATQSRGIPEIPAYLVIVRQVFDGPYFVCWNSSPITRIYRWSSFTFQNCRWFAQLKPRLRSEPESKEGSYYRRNWDGVIKRQSWTALGNNKTHKSKCISDAPSKCTKCTRNIIIYFWILKFFYFSDFLQLFHFHFSFFLSLFLSF